MKFSFRDFFHKKCSVPAGQEQPAAGTDRIRQAETAERRLEVILNAVSEGVLVMNEKLLIQRVNPKARTLFGIDCLGLSLLEAARSTELEALAQQALTQQNPVEQDIKLYIAGDQQYFHICAAPLKDSAQPEGLVLVLTEFTRLHKLEQVRKDFAANVSHELRTPIQLVKGFAETLLDSPLEDADQIRHYIGIILKNAQTMENLTADLLSLVSLEEGGNFPFAIQETLVYPLFQEALASVESGAQKKDIRISLKCPAELKAVLYGPFIIQGLINLLDNAVKYSPAGSRVWAEAAVQMPCETADPELIITVRDEGIGIPAKHLGRIFERFYRVDRARSRAQGGTGLGLAIVRHIALLHQGTAEAESHAGEGSVFRIRIPYHNPVPNS